SPPPRRASSERSFPSCSCHLLPVDGCCFAHSAFNDSAGPRLDLRGLAVEFRWMFALGPVGHRIERRGPKTNASRPRNGPWRAARKERGNYLIRLMMLNIGRYRAMTETPTAPPTNIIMMG